MDSLAQVPKRIWTFRIQGGQALSMSIPGSPVLQHEGGMTVWKLLGTEEWARKVERVLTTLYGCSVTLTTEEQTPELLSSRLRES